MSKLRFGILSTAKIGVDKVIPAMQAGKHCAVVAIASRDLAKAKAAAEKLGIPKAYGSYEELLADPEVDAVYNPLPNHMHVPWSIKCLEAGKHVLCEKPIGMNSGEAEQLLAAAGRHPRLKIMEAFMYRHHPQWQLARRLVAEGQIGQPGAIQSFFSYHNVNPDNIRNMADIGGGGLMDIGCYCISLSRFIFNAEPKRAIGLVEFDPNFKTDRLATAIMDFGSGNAKQASNGNSSEGLSARTSTFTCSTQLAYCQRVIILGNEGRVELEIPFNAPTNKQCKIFYFDQRGQVNALHEVQICNQYAIQGDLFAQAVLENKPVPTPLSDAVANMRAIEAVFASAKTGGWVEV